MANARKIAVEALLKVNTDKGYSNIVLNKIFKENTTLSGEDKALASALFYGVLDRKITLDYVLNSLTKTPFKKVNYFTAEVMRVGLYQIMYMDRIPNSAAVDEAVKLVKKSRENRNSGFVNAVLREAIRRENLLPAGDSVKDLSVIYSVPEWIINEFISSYGKETAIELLKEFLKVPKASLRVNTLKITKESLKNELEKSGVKCSVHNELPAIILENGFDTEKSGPYKNGLFHTEDISSQYAAATVKAKKGERVLDMCASPGGKSFYMAEDMENTGEIIACDIYEKRVELIRNGAQRLELNIIKPTVNDASVFNENLGEFDAVLCDVPCSGLGTIGRKPDLKYKEVTCFTDLENLQQKILFTAARYLKQNGRIVYSTCTLRKQENEQNIEKFLAEHKDFKLEYSHTFFPHIDGTNGFFVALLRQQTR